MQFETEAESGQRHVCTSEEVLVKSLRPRRGRCGPLDGHHWSYLRDCFLHNSKSHMLMAQSDDGRPPGYSF